MGARKKRHTRKKRRQGNAALKFGPEAKPRHQLLSGRTGKAHSKKLQSRRPRKQ
jgi:hypothetical protein